MVSCRQNNVSLSFAAGCLSVCCLPHHTLLIQAYPFLQFDFKCTPHLCCHQSPSRSEAHLHATNMLSPVALIRSVALAHGVSAVAHHSVSRKSTRSS